MKLMTKEILGKLKSNPSDTAGNKPWLKLFNPTGSGTWLISEIEDDGDTLFGLCDLGHGSPELGYVSLSELASLKLPFGLGKKITQCYESLSETDRCEWHEKEIKIQRLKLLNESLEENISDLVDQIKYKKDVIYLIEHYGFSLRAITKIMNLLQSTTYNWLYGNNVTFNKKQLDKLKTGLILIKEKLKENEEYTPDF